MRKLFRVDLEQRTSLTSSKPQSYKSRKSSDFASWDSWEDGLRLEVLSITRRPFCAFGYDRLLSERIGEVRDLIDFCKDVRFDEERS